MNSQHEWIKIEITPVHVIADPAGIDDPVVLVDPDDAIEAEEATQYGCSLCDVVLDIDTVNTLCSGGEEDEEIEILGQEPLLGPMLDEGDKR